MVSAKTKTPVLELGPSYPYQSKSIRIAEYILMWFLTTPGKVGLQQRENILGID
jgi:hypothetical protein